MPAKFLLPLGGILECRRDRRGRDQGLGGQGGRNQEVSPAKVLDTSLRYLPIKA